MTKRHRAQQFERFVISRAHRQDSHANKLATSRTLGPFTPRRMQAALKQALKLDEDQYRALRQELRALVNGTKTEFVIAGKVRIVGGAGGLFLSREAGSLLFSVEQEQR